MAWRNAGYPGTGEYFDQLSSMACLALCLMPSGVLKSGSPTLRLITSMPCAFISLLFCDITSVAEGARRLSLSDSCAMVCCLFIAKITLFFVLTHKTALYFFFSFTFHFSPSFWAFVCVHRLSTGGGCGPCAPFSCAGSRCCRGWEWSRWGCSPRFPVRRPPGPHVSRGCW